MGAARLVLLGTAGGPLPSPVRSGIAQAVVVGERTFVVDCGTGVARQLRRARLLSSLSAVFLTHLHSDHDCDYFNLFLLGWPVLRPGAPIPVFGPGPAGGAGALPPPPRGHHASLVHPASPTPGLVESTEHRFRAHAYDLNVRMRDSGRGDLRAMVSPREIPVDPSVGARAPDRTAPPMAPVTVMEDAAVRVRAVLVPHGPVFPSFAYRFDTDAGSVVVSGDTAPSDNLVALAEGADVLVHEVFEDGGQPDPEDWEEEQRLRHMLASHTPAGEVGKVAAAAGVRRLVLTHFVPGDDARPDEHWLARVRGDFAGEVVVGHDLLVIDLNR